MPRMDGIIGCYKEVYGLKNKILGHFSKYFIYPFIRKCRRKWI
jgi:hypothetical protein